MKLGSSHGLGDRPGTHMDGTRDGCREARDPAEPIAVMPTARKPKHRLWTVGHSTRTVGKFIELLNAHDIREIVDVRTIPKSRHNPQFNEEIIQRSLQDAGIQYAHLVDLGGLRHTTLDSKNLGWHNRSFRGFADHMGTPAFANGMELLEEIGNKVQTAIMCAEAVPWRCHRSLIADALTKRHWDIFDIMTLNSAPKHRLTPFLKVRQGKLTYPIPMI